jgi:hypothetical protein
MLNTMAISFAGGTGCQHKYDYCSSKNVKKNLLHLKSLKKVQYYLLEIQRKDRYSFTIVEVAKIVISSFYHRKSPCIYQFHSENGIDCHLLPEYEFNIHLCTLKPKPEYHETNFFTIKYCYMPADSMQ